MYTQVGRNRGSFAIWAKIAIVCFKWWVSYGSPICCESNLKFNSNIENTLVRWFFNRQIILKKAKIFKRLGLNHFCHKLGFKKELGTWNRLYIFLFVSRRQVVTHDLVEHLIESHACLWSKTELKAAIAKMWLANRDDGDPQSGHWRKVSK